MRNIVELFAGLAFPIIATAGVSILVQLAAQRFTVFPRSAGNGLFLVMLPIGCNLFGAQISPMVSAIWTVVGLFQIIWSLRRSKFQFSPSTSGIESLSRSGDT